MKLNRSLVKAVVVLQIILMLTFTTPYQSALAAMIGTEATLDSMRAQQARVDINGLLMRKGVRNALTAQGITPLEAKARIDSLSDAEVIRLADQIDKLPAGGNTMALIGVAIIAAMIIWYAIIHLAVMATDD